MRDALPVMLAVAFEYRDREFALTARAQGHIAINCDLFAQHDERVAGTDDLATVRSGVT